MSLNRLSLSATVHCLTGCAIGEVLGMVLSTWWGWGGAASITLWWSLAVALLVAGALAWPVNRWLIARGRGHAVMHAHHHG